MALHISNYGALYLSTMEPHKWFDLWSSIIDLYELHFWWIDSWSSIIINTCCVDRTDPKGPEINHPPLERNYLVPG